MEKCKDGFTLVELIVVIAVLAVLAGIAIPRFMNANMAARGSKILADMNACESAINIYYVKNGDYPLNTANLVSSYMANWPKPPAGNALVKKHDNNNLILDVQATKYVYTEPPTGTELDTRVGRITLGGMTIEDILSTSEDSLILK